MDGKGYRVTARINDGKEIGEYSGAKDPYTAIEKCLEGIRRDLPAEGKLTIEYFPVGREEVKAHILTGVSPPSRLDKKN